MSELHNGSERKGGSTLQTTVLQKRTQNAIWHLCMYLQSNKDNKEQIAT